MKENAIEWITGSDIATVTFSQQKYINRVLQLAEIDPDSVEIIETPEDNHGYLVAHISTNRVQISKRAPLSEETRKRLSEEAKRKFG